MSKTSGRYVYGININNVYGTSTVQNGSIYHEYLQQAAEYNLETDTTVLSTHRSQIGDLNHSNYVLPVTNQKMAIQIPTLIQLISTLYTPVNSLSTTYIAPRTHNSTPNAPRLKKVRIPRGKYFWIHGKCGYVRDLCHTNTMGHKYE